MADLPITLDRSAWLEKLLSLSTTEEQRTFLETSGSRDAEGLSQLLDEAMQLARSDPAKARQLALICGQNALQAGFGSVLGRALYVRAQTHALQGEFSQALELIQEANSAFEASGENFEALRTNLGLMHVFNELGRHYEALDAGQAILDAYPPEDELQPEVKAIVALAHLNQGVCFETIGRYEDALGAYDRAEALFTELQMNEHLGDVGNNRAIVLTHLGRVSQALEALQKASEIMAETGQRLSQAQALSNIAEAHLMLGEYSRSLNAFEQARRLFEELGAQADLGILLRKTADAYLALNLIPEALDLYQTADQMLAQAGMADQRARTLWGLGVALISRSSFEQALSSLQLAAALFESAGNVPMQGSVMLEQSALLAIQGDRQGALHLAKTSHALLSGERWPVQFIFACLRLADLLLPDDPEAAEKNLQEASELAETLSLPIITYRLHSRLGKLYRLQGQPQHARREFETAIASIEGLRGNLAHESTRASFLQDKTAVYADLLHLLLQNGDPESLQLGFSVAEQAKSRALVDLLAGVIPARPAYPDDPILTQQLENLQADLSATYNRFLEVSGQEDEEQPAVLQARAIKLEGEINRLRLQAESRARTAVHPIETAYSYDNLHASLPVDLPLVCYHIIDEEILAFIMVHGKVEVLRAISQTPAVRTLLERLNTQWSRFRVTGDFIQRNLPLMEKSTRRILGSLYQELFSPIDAWLAKELAPEPGTPLRLVIIPHGLLHQVPFHALFDGRDYLIDRMELSYALSATVYALCQGRQNGSGRGLVMGLADPLIPLVESESRSVERALLDSQIQAQRFTGQNATREVLFSAASGSQVIHLACHGLFRGDNPMFSALKLSNGWLTAAEVLQLHLDGALVTLSACESGRNRVINGDEVIGLPRAFLGAGAATVVVSLWIVPDEASNHLMSRWYRGLQAGLGRASSLRKAQLDVKTRYSHPFYWAPFVLIGQR